MKHMRAHKWRVVFLMTAAIMSSTPAFPTTITFNEAGLVAGFGPQQLGLNPQGTALSNQLASLGVTFTNNGVVNYVSDGPSTGFIAGASGNYLVVLNNTILGPPPFGYLTATFGANGANNISLDLFDGNANPSPRVVVRAYDASNTQLGASLGLMNFGGTLTIPFAHHIQIEDTGADGFVIDNLSFTLAANGNGNVAHAPEPGTWLLLGAGLTVLGTIRRRKAAARG